MGTLSRIGHGAAAGAIATLPMSAVMLVAQRLGLLGRQPPAAIAGSALESLGIDRSPVLHRLAAVVAHVGFGAAAGALFAALRRPRTRRRAALEGAIYGTGVWAASYAGWVPALDILPPPSDDRPGRPSTMVVAHWIYGVVLGLLAGGRSSTVIR